MYDMNRTSRVCYIAIVYLVVQYESTDKTVALKLIQNSKSVIIDALQRCDA